MDDLSDSPRALSLLAWCRAVNRFTALRFHQWAILVRDANGDHRWTICPESGAEGFLDLLLCFGHNACAAETLRGGYDVQTWKVKAGDIRSIFQFRKFLEDGVLVVARHDEHRL